MVCGKDHLSSCASPAHLCQAVLLRGEKRAEPWIMKKSHCSDFSTSMRLDNARMLAFFVHAGAHVLKPEE